MNRYSKGARGERELLNFLYEKGYSVIRAAGSGVNSLSPDLLAVREGRGIAFECKAWDSSSIFIEPDKVEVLKKWESNSKMELFIGWRINGKGWFFIKLNELNKAEKNYTVTKKIAMSINRRLEHITKLETVVEVAEVVQPMG